MPEALLEVRDLTKNFGGVAALSNGQFTLRAGTVHALCGGNGAGKSTLLTIVMGIQDRDGGVIRLNGREVDFDKPSDARAAGITIIEQELSPVPAMSVAENIFLGREPVGLFGRVDFATMNHNAQELLDSLSFDISPKTLMMDLTVAEVQLVEIAKALSYDAEVIIMDEPTSALGEAEVDQLFETIERLKAAGKGIVYVSHRLSEIMDVADEYTVFRDGRFVADGKIADVSREELIQMIVGRPLTEEFVKENQATSEVALSVSGLNAAGWVKDVSFEVCKGEILALYGLMGSGRSEIFERIFGLTQDEGGEIQFFGEKVRMATPSEAIKRGVALVTEDRKGTGLVLDADVRSNICMAQLEELSVGPVMQSGRESAAASRMIEMFDIKTPNDRLPVSGLSGGNQQKVVLGKWFLTEPKVLLLDEPTRGVDVGAKREIYRVISDFARAGGAVVMVSSENDEVLGMADRVLIMRDGRVSGMLTRDELSAEKLVHLAA
ncbi:sugar ABC transporter ATP-binding protein [Aliiruegeria lutimaris]|uniref:Monosaccharide ABC transporter ATP-binding protein, CUT2 family n=1 Tax=Aliiruegeria lutimaris TaxID=571298 RepID=A0A1G8T4P8_9RHOB|nr:sugar ABC transporter ATP-binding protein [Aliiruegeria lutimaris]SDJ36579.1 monosaccharide ABC transporter ATP-binding protein, CUT2 family [Aliiruegeria lutimaris]